MTTHGTKPIDKQLQAHERAKLFCVVGIPTLLTFGVGALRTGNWVLVGLVMANAVIVSGCYLALVRGQTHFWAIRISVAAFAVLATYLVALSGEEHSFALWFFAFPVVAVMLLPPREGVVWAALCLAVATGVMILGGPETGTSTYSMAFGIRFVIVNILLTTCIYWFEITLHRYQEETSAQKSLIEAESARLRTEIARRTSLEGELRVLASIDPLTSLLNRRAFLERFSHELARGQRHGPDLTLLMLDLDHFKKINDQHGHPAGDLVLVHFAQSLRRCLRNVDIIGRIGGEEFAVVLVDTSPEMAQPVIDRLLEQTRGTPAILADGTVVHYTVSIGSTEVLRGDTMETAIQRADDGLYAAKNMGRDRHCQR